MPVFFGKFIFSGLFLSVFLCIFNVFGVAGLLQTKRSRVQIFLEEQIMLNISQEIYQRLRRYSLLSLEPRWKSAVVGKKVNREKGCELKIQVHYRFCDPTKAINLL